MKQFLVTLVLVVVALPATCSAVVPTPTPTATATPNVPPPQCTPTVNQLKSICIRGRVDTAGYQCSVESPDLNKYAVTARGIADQVISEHQCAATTTKRGCEKCYDRANRTLRRRVKGTIVQPLVNTAADLIRSDRLCLCPQRPN